MHMTYGAEAISTSEENLKMFCKWHYNDPVDDWEIVRNARISTIQGNSNPYIDGAYLQCIDICKTLFDKGDL